MSSEEERLADAAGAQVEKGVDQLEMSGAQLEASAAQTVEAEASNTA